MIDLISTRPGADGSKDPMRATQTLIQIFCGGSGSLKKVAAPVFASLSLEDPRFGILI